MDQFSNSLPTERTRGPFSQREAWCWLASPHTDRRTRRLSTKACGRGGIVTILFMIMLNVLLMVLAVPLFKSSSGASAAMGKESGLASTKKDELEQQHLNMEQAATAGAKKKKKRRNKKKSAAAAAEGEGSDDSDVEVAPQASGVAKRAANGGAPEDAGNLGPHALLVSACVKQGFSPDEVHAAISWLFENNKEYDSVEAITRHLRGEEDPSLFDVIHSPITSFASAAVEEPVAARAQSPVQAAPAPVEEEPPAVPLETRLEMAVSHEDLEASLGALIAFIMLAKDESQWEEQRKPVFESKALELLMVNVLSQSIAHPTHYPAKLHDKLQLLLQHLLGSSSAVHELVQVIQHTQKLNQRSPLSQGAVQSIADAVASTFREYSSKYDSAAAAELELPRLEHRLANTRTPDRQKANLSPKELFTLRESRVELVGNYRKACGLLLGSLATPAVASGAGTTPLSETLLETLLKDSLQVSADGLKEKRTQIERLRAEMSSVHSAMEVELQPLRVDVAGCKSQLEELRTRRDTLLRELAAVNSDIANTEARQERLEGLISDRIQSFEDAHSKRDQRLKNMLSIMHKADEAEAIAKHVTAIESRLSREVRDRQGGKQEDLEGRLMARLPGFVDALDAYLDVEVKCYEFLSDRTKQLDGEVAAIAKSIAQFQASGLGMKDSLLALSEQKSLKESHSAEDKAALLNLREHADGLYQVLRSAIERLKILPLGVDKAALARVKQGLNRMDVAKSWVLDGIVLPDPVSSLLLPRAASPAPPIVSRPEVKKVSPPQPAVPVSARPPGFIGPPATSSPVPPPASSGPTLKLSWASRVAGASPAVAARSLTEIQAEEVRLTEENLKRFEQDKTRPPAPGLVGSELEAERATETENTLGGSWASDGGATAEAAAKEAEEDLQARLGGLLNGNTGTVA